MRGRGPGRLAALPSPARAAAVAALGSAWDAQAPGLATLLEQEASQRSLSSLDAALAREIALGVARNRLLLDEILSHLIERPLRPRAAPVLEALRAGLFQLLFLDRVPEHAVVDETVRLVGSMEGQQALKGLVNAVLRRVARMPAAERLPDVDAPWPLALSVPEWLAENVTALIGEQEARAFFEASQRPAPLCLRARDASAPSPVEGAVPGDLAPGCFVLEGRGVSPASLPGFDKGGFTVQDEGAQAAVIALTSGLEVRRALDFCASPGGKTTQIADAFPDAEVAAVDLPGLKLDRLRETLVRLRLADRIPIRAVNTLKGLGPGSFDFVLVDAPCSGLGTLRRHPEIRYRRTGEDLRRLGDLQVELLKRASRYVAPGGRLAYCVCTITREEGEETCRRFLNARPGFVADTLDTSACGLGRDPDAGEGGILRLWTHRHGCDGYTFARFRRTS